MEILFKIKLNGRFVDGIFYPIKEAKTLVITKFTDGSFEAKLGRQVLKSRYTKSSFLINSLKKIGINL